ncbi:MAG: ThuA domain-containing protein [Planctomycetia bacterium]|nr:ThuA domain-containing protein [Planctomycetia bacterium]
MLRREFLATATFSLAALPLASSLSAVFGEETTSKKILYFTRSQGFEHDPVKLGKDGKSLSEKTLARLAKDRGYELVSTKDGDVFDGDLSGYSAFIFYTSGQLDQEGGDGHKPISAEGLQNLLSAIRGGTGFLGFHSSTDTWNRHTGYKVDPVYEQHEYILMHGGEFIVHGAQQEATVEVVDETLPSLKKREPSFRLHEEWYANKNFAPDMRVLASLQTAGMDNKDNNQCYDRPAFPCIWARREKKGPVAYCAMGHKMEFWSNGEFDDLIGDLIDVATGAIVVPTTPNLKQCCPGADMLQNSWRTGLVNTSD